MQDVGYHSISQAFHQKGSEFGLHMLAPILIEFILATTEQYAPDILYAKYIFLLLENT
jgi:hypothetical protein